MSDDITETSLETGVTLIKDEGDIKKWVDETFQNGHKKTVHVHFLDFGDPTMSGKHTGMMVGNLSRDLKNLSMYSEGVIMSCAAQKGKHDIVLRAIDKLMDDANVDEYKQDSQRGVVVALCEPSKVVLRQLEGKAPPGALRLRGVGLF